MSATNNETKKIIIDSRHGVLGDEAIASYIDHLYRK